MIKITNGVDVFEVTNGAFNGVYAKQGYSVIPAVAEAHEEEESGESKDPKKTEDEIFCDELLEKPIAQWNKEEVKKYAEINEIDIAGTKNANEAKELIKAYIEK